MKYVRPISDTSEKWGSHSSTIDTSLSTRTLEFFPWNLSSTLFCRLIFVKGYKVNRSSESIWRTKPAQMTSSVQSIFFGDLRDVRKCVRCTKIKHVIGQPGASFSYETFSKSANENFFQQERCIHLTKHFWHLSNDVFIFLFRTSTPVYLISQHLEAVNDMQSLTSLKCLKTFFSFSAFPLIQNIYTFKKQSWNLLKVGSRFYFFKYVSLILCFVIKKRRTEDVKHVHILSLQYVSSTVRLTKSILGNRLCFCGISDVLLHSRLEDTLLLKLF